MESQGFESVGLIGDYEDASYSTSLPKSSAISHKLTSILSTSFANTELRDVLRGLDEKGIQNTPETRRRLRLDAQKEVIDRNSDIIQDFGLVAEVGPPRSDLMVCASAEMSPATSAYWIDNSKPESLLRGYASTCGCCTTRDRSCA